MRTLILTTTAVATLALAACNQPAESPSAPAAADNAIDAVAIDKNAPPPAPVVQAPRPAPRSAPAPANAASADTEEAAAAAGTAAEAPSTGMMDGPSPEVRDTAKEKAEATNLRPN
ncbi:hypothetical protein [Brevundimonas sp.]|uniref:hypothetical protein n=1 Tax=Brevundimonas sp. TaxID=1871086 RepID=UPI0035B1F547